MQTDQYPSLSCRCRDFIAETTVAGWSLLHMLPALLIWLLFTAAIVFEVDLGRDGRVRIPDEPTEPHIPAQYQRLSTSAEECPREVVNCSPTKGDTK